MEIAWRYFFQGLMILLVGAFNNSSESFEQQISGIAKFGGFVVDIKFEKGCPIKPSGWFHGLSQCSIAKFGGFAVDIKFEKDRSMASNGYDPQMGNSTEVKWELV
ncbi:hypothetical protein L6452_13794 [Arctium lappa]|uniref:Uncharacterized protein n=1 Tax=Arctium lappa TaxID=4217 RepID=A0ACB9CJI9_ARCLA|nr:hypothetical protein L6452_13794 [Arctium lappa]